MPDYAKWVSKALAAAGLGGAATVATPDDAEAMFGGPMARTANKAALKIAQGLEKQSAPRNLIFDQTGWFRGADGKWRFEIPDVGAEYRFRPKDFSYPKNMNEEELQTLLNERLDNPKATVGETFRHPSLYMAYPEVRRMGFVGFPSHLDRNATAFAYDNPLTTRTTIGMGDETARALPSFRNPLAKPPDPTSVMLHELQHGIQTIEGFAPGGALNSPGVVDYARALLGKPNLAYQDLQKFREGRKALHEGYRRLIGENEAYNVQKRYEMLKNDLNLLNNPNPTPEQARSIMRSRPPWATEEFPAAQQIELPPAEYQFPFRFPRDR